MERTTTSPEFSPTRIASGTVVVRPICTACCFTDSCIRSAAIAGPDGVILLGQRRAEEGHDPVAHHLIDGAIVAMDRIHHPLQHRVENPARVFGVTVGQQFHRSLQISEEDRHLLSLAFEGDLRVKDALGRMLREWLASGVKPGQQGRPASTRSRGRTQDRISPLGGAEAAISASPRQGRGALFAELRAGRFRC